jgi:hypothetical protein
LSLLKENEHLVEHGPGRVRFTFRSCQGYLVASRHDLRERERRFDLPQARVTFPQELNHQMVAGDTQENLNCGGSGHRRASLEAKDGDASGEPIER